MLSIKVNNEDLDLRPGTTMDLEQNNPYLQFNATDVIGEYSFPISVPNTQKNNRLLKLSGSFQKRVDNNGVEVALYDNNYQDSIGTLKTEKVNVDLNRMQNGDLSCYYLTGTSYFNKAIDKKKLRDVDFGGDRTFAWDNYNRNGAGFWGHIHKVLDAAPGYGTSGYDYAFFSVINKNFTWDKGGSDVINWTWVNPQGLRLFLMAGTVRTDGNIIVPYPYLKFILEKIFASIGWTLKGAILDDPDFEKITVDNARAIDWCIYDPKKTALQSSIPVGRPDIAFDIADHVPDVTISEFLSALRSRFGWWYDVDRKSKVVTIQMLKDVAATGVKDYTRKASPLVPKTILTAKKIYALKTAGSDAINLSGLVDKGTVPMPKDLPAAAQAIDNNVYLVISENNYYLCQANDTTGIWEWKLFNANTGDVVPAGATDDIITTAATAGSEKYDNQLDLAPRIDSGGFWPGRTDDSQTNQILLLFYYGIRYTKTGYPYPFASHHIYDSNGQQVGNWSLSFLAKKNDGTDIGLYALNWKPFLDKLSTTEQLAVTLYLSRAELLNLKFHDELNIAGVKMYISKIKRKISYDGKIDLECSRI
jgi:hypothetical protein